MIDLSVLICSTHTRSTTFGPAIQKQVWDQLAALPAEDQARIEILMLTDNKSMMLGFKRNTMVDMAQGRYVQFVDDDDRIAPDMFRRVLDATASNADVITFLAAVSLNGNSPKTCHYSLDYVEDRNTENGYQRVPNHICAIRRDLARQVSYPHVAYGEDSGYSRLLRPLLRTEHHIDRVLYFYDYCLETTEAQSYLRNLARGRPALQPVVDVVILSNVTTSELQRSTQRTIDTCVDGANGLPVGVAVLEQCPNIEYRRAATIRMPAEFNYNKFANFGASRGSADWILVANNDLIFRDGWLHSLLAANHPLVSPKCPRDERQSEFTENKIGSVTGKHLSGWCYMISRDLWDRMGGLDDSVTFWCSDDVVIEQAAALGVKPMIVPSSIVEHDQSSTLKTTYQSSRDELTWGQLDKFIAKYGSHRMQNHPDFLRWKSSAS